MREEKEEKKKKTIVGKDNNTAKEANQISKSRAEAEASSSPYTNTNRSHGLNKTTADFQCFVCGAIFTTDQDRKQHLEKEAHGTLRTESDEEDQEIAKQQEELNESHFHHI